MIKIYDGDVKSFANNGKIAIKPEELKQEIIIQMLKCDAALTKHAEAEFEKYAKQEK